MIGLNELFDEIRKKKKLNFKVYYSWFEAISNNLNVTAKTMFLLSKVDILVLFAVFLIKATET